MDGTEEHHLVKMDRLRRPKAACFSSYLDYRPKTNAALSWYTKVWPHTGGIGQGKEAKNLNVIDVLPIQE
jgi:hypothetical protein